MTERVAFLLDADPAWLAETMERLWNTPGLKIKGSAESRREAEEQFRLLSPDIILVGEGLKKDVPAVARANPQAFVFLVSGNATGDTWREAMAAGARGVVGRNFEPQALLEQVEALSAEESRRLTEAQAPGTAGDRRVGVGVASLRQAVIAVWSPKGGAGKTTVAVNLAATFAASPLQPRVCLVDADVDFGDVAAALQVPVGNRTISQWAEDPAAAERDPMSFLVEVAKIPGLWILPAPLHVTEEMHVTGEFMERLIGALRRHFDVVVLDLGTDLRRDSTVVALRQATQVLVVAHPYLPALGEIDMASEVLEGPFGIDPKRIKMVINRVYKRDSLVKEIPQHIHWPVEATLPEDGAVVDAANRGSVIALANPDHPFSAGIRRLANRAAQAQVVPEARPPLLRRFFRRRSA